MAGNKWVKILALIFANGVNYLIGFLTAPFLSRTLSLEDNGTYNQLILLVNLFVLLAQFGIVNIITVFFADKRYEQNVTFVTSLRVLFFSASFATLLFLSGVFYFHHLLNNPTLQNYIVVAAPVVFFQALGSGIIVILIYFDKVKTVSAYTVISNVVRIAGLFYCIVVLNSITALVVWFTIFTIIQNVILFMFIPKWLINRPYIYNKNLQYEMIQKAWPLLLTSILGVGTLYIDGFMVSGMLSVKDYALYRNGAIEIPFIATVYSSIASIMMPNFARLYSENRITDLLKEKRDVSRLIATIIFPVIIAFIVFSEELIPLYLSDKYYESYLVFAIYNLTTLIRVNDYQDLLTISGRSKTVLNINVLVFIYNIVANVFLLQMFGIAGGAIAFTSTVYLLVWLLVRASCLEFKVLVKEYIDYKSMFIMLFFSLSICILFKLLFPLFAYQNSVLLVFIGLSIFIPYLIYYRMNFIALDKLVDFVKSKMYDRKN
jgi:O-antigen/teichoic acid export membrane protein